MSDQKKALDQMILNVAMAGWAGKEGDLRRASDDLRSYVQSIAIDRDAVLEEVRSRLHDAGVLRAEAFEAADEGSREMRSTR